MLGIPGANPEPVSPFQSHILSFLHNVLVSSTETGHTLICSLSVPGDPAYLHNNEALQLLYINAVNECLEGLGQLHLLDEGETDSDSQYESDQTLTTHVHRRQSVTKESQKLTNLVYNLLSLMDPSPDMAHVTVDKLFVSLLQARYQLGPGKLLSFDAKQLYACLLGRSSPFLLKRLHNAEEYIRKKEAMLSGGKEAVSSRWSLEVLEGIGTLQGFRELFYYAHHDQRHFLECVLVSLPCTCVMHYNLLINILK